MFDELDELLRKLLMRELAIKNGEVDIQFNQPSREWSQRLSRPTLNLFLYDLRENKKLRQTAPMWQTERSDATTVGRRRVGVRADLCYMITAWAKEPEDEHSLLSRAWLALLRFPYLPKELMLESLQAQPVPIPMMVGQPEELRNPADIWNVLDNEMRPALACTITLCLEPYEVITTGVVRSRLLRVGPSSRPPTQRPDEGAELYETWTVGGNVQSKKPLEQVRMVLVERDQPIAVQPSGRFVIGPLQAGEYTLEVRTDGATPRKIKVKVPSADCTIEV